MNRFRRAFLTVCAVSLILGGCGTKTVEEEKADAPEIQKEFHKGGAPLTVRVTISKKSITIADTISMVIDAEYDEGVRVTMPDLSNIGFGGFIVRDYKVIPESTSPDGKLETSSRFLLEPQLSGEYVIQPFKVGFALEGEQVAEDAKEYPHNVESEPLKIEVNSLVQGDPSRITLRPIQGPVELPHEKTSWANTVTIAAMIAGGILLVAIVLLIGGRYRPKKVSKPVPPHVRAMEALKRLREKQLVEKGFIKEFYYEISDIMRHYIEDRFRLSAPEQTTDEFLYSMSTNGYFDPSTRDLLKTFLEHCDLVKFARYAPETDEIQRTFNVTRDFIESTKEEKNNGV